MQALWSQYINNLQQKPLQTKVITSLALGVTSNLISQSISNPNGRLDIAKLARFATVSVAQTPLIHLWYKLLEKLFGSINSKAIRVLVMVLSDQLIFSPLIVSFYLYLTAVLEGKKPEKEVKTKLPSTLVLRWKIWPVAQILNFTLIPLQYRVLFGNLVALIWGIALSIRK